MYLTFKDDQVHLLNISKLFSHPTELSAFLKLFQTHTDKLELLNKWIFYIKICKKNNWSFTIPAQSTLGLTQQDSQKYKDKFDQLYPSEFTKPYTINDLNPQQKIQFAIFLAEDVFYHNTINHDIHASKLYIDLLKSNTNYTLTDVQDISWKYANYDGDKSTARFTANAAVRSKINHEELKSALNHALKLDQEKYDYYQQEISNIINNTHYTPNIDSSKIDHYKLRNYIERKIKNHPDPNYFEFTKEFLHNLKFNNPKLLTTQIPLVENNLLINTLVNTKTLIELMSYKPYNISSILHYANQL